MNLKKKLMTLVSFMLMALIAIVMTVGCAGGKATPQANTSEYILAQNTAAASISSIPSPSPTLFPEPSVRPPLPPSAKWNPETGYYYDPTQFEWNSITHSYKELPHPTPSEYITGKVATQTGAEWIAEHQNSTDEVDIAIINYMQARQQSWQKLKNEPDWKFSSARYVGAEEGGPLTILTDLGITKLQELVNRVQWENPFVIYIEIGADQLCRVRSSQIGFWDFQVAKWKTEFNNKASNSKSQVDEITQALANKTADEKIVQEKFADLGIFALPEVYELVINQGNTSLIKYLPDILPLDKMKEYNVKAGQTDEATLKQALASCQDEIKIIKTLHAD